MTVDEFEAVIDKANTLPQAEGVKMVQEALKQCEASVVHTEKFTLWAVGNGQRRFRP